MVELFKYTRACAKFRSSYPEIWLLTWFGKEFNVLELKKNDILDQGFHCLFGWLASERPRQQLGYIADGSQGWRLKMLRAATHETERANHEFCLSRSHYTDTHPTSRQRAATVGIEPTTSSPGVARSTD